MAGEITAIWQIIGSPSSPLKRLRMSSGSVARQEEVYVPFADLTPGVERLTKVMVCRRWDASNVAGKYISTEFILSDFTGNAIHCVARSSIAHCFASKLEVGEIYSMRRFTVHPNKETYRLRSADLYLIQLEGNSIVKKLHCSPDGFERHPFQLQDLEHIVLNGNRFLIDVIGSVVNMGKVRPTRNGSQILDFELLNERGFTIKVTLWGALCDDLVRRVRGAPELYIILLTSMNVKDYRGEFFLSSISATCIYDSDEVEEIAQLRQTMEGMVVPEPNHDGSLLRLLQLGRQLRGLNRQQSITLYCTVRVIGIRERNSWHYFSCGSANCRKGLARVENSFWCESCERVCEFPIPRFRLELDVSDPTATVVVTVFDEIAESMVTKSVASVLQAHEDDDENEIPHELMHLVNTTHVLELKTHTYYDHGDYESFTASRLIRTVEDGEIPPPATEGPDNRTRVVVDTKGETCKKASIGFNGDKCEEEADYTASENTNEAPLSSVIHTALDEIVEGVEEKLSDPPTPVTTPKKASKLDVVTSPKED